MSRCDCGLSSWRRKRRPANEAERVYKLALEADPALETAHLGLAQMWMNRRELARSLEVIEKGLENNPGSVRLLLVKTDLLSQLGRRLESRQALEEAFRLSPNDPNVVSRTAAMRDAHGDHAGQTYEALAALLTRDQAAQTAIKTALDRGLVVSLRDGDHDRALQFAQRLRQLGALDIPDLNSSKPVSSNLNTVTVPGGMKALALAALMHEDVRAERFVAEYTAALTRHTRGRNQKSREAYLNPVRNYFQTLSSLKALAKTNGNCAEIVLCPTGNLALDSTERVLKLLGWRMKRSGKKILLEVSTDESEAVKQPYLAALGVDEVQMKLALENGAPFTLRVIDQQVPVIFDEKFWLERGPEVPRPRVGLLEAMLENLGAARFYSSLAAMNEETQNQVVRVAELKQFFERDTDLLSAYGAALSIVNGRVLLPGGDDATPIWGQFTGRKPEDARAFIGSLFARDDGKALAFFHLLTNLPPLQQRFFTKSTDRLNRFYKAFPFTEKEDLKRHAVIRRDVHFRDLAHELPLDDQGNIRFPGSVRIWLGAKGEASIARQVPDRLGDASRRVVPEIEDEVLLRMLDTRCEVDGARFNRVETFLALVRLERHRTEPLDEASAVLLADNYLRYREVFPFFAALPDLSFRDFSSFFQACRNLESLDKRLLNLALGEFQALLQLAALLFESGALADSAAAAVVTSTCDLFARAKEPFHFAQASLQSLQHLLDALKPSHQPAASSSTPENPTGTRTEAPATPDERLLSAVSGPAKRVSFRVQDREYAVDRPSQQREKMRNVLDLQLATRLDTLLRIHQAASRLLRGQGETLRSIEEIESAIPELKEVDVRTQKSLNASVRQKMVFGRPEELLVQVGNLREEAEKQNSKKLPAIATELLEQLNPFIKNSLVAWIYAYYFSPQDLVIAEDPFFVRRHQFFEDDLHHRSYWPGASQRTHPLGPGTFIGGVLFQLGLMAGKMGLTQVEAGTSFSGHSTIEALTRTQIASVRAVPWARLTQNDVHAVGVTLRFAKEVVVAASLRPELASEVGQLTLGLIGLGRRSQLLSALTHHDVEGALRLLSSSDLYFLAERFWQKHGTGKLGENPTTLAMQQINRSSARTSADFFGGPHLKTFGCLHNHLPALRPYEDYENFRLADAMSERLGHFLLDLAESLDRLGIPVEALAVVGEPAVRELAKNATMNDRDDWMAVIESAAQVRIPELILAVQK